MSDEEKPTVSPPDAAELEKFGQFLVEVAAHQMLERAARQRLRFRSVSLPESYWNPDAAPPKGEDA